MPDLASAHDIRKSDDSDIKQVCDILGNAFTDDPVLTWMSGQPQIYSALFRSEAEALYKHHGHVYINREQTGAAMWLPPGVSAETPFHWRLFHIVWLLFTTSGTRYLKRSMALEKTFADKHPKYPHFYLFAIGATLGNQGRGIGSALLKAGLSACDAAGMPAYLESSNEANNALYERHGFKTIEVITLPDEGPAVWMMQRD
ncbi:MAG: GNAT family N-acetyltransferase [Gammaproteobacteria bacterium]|nr:GNAT family N-acetyltransferase [Gammaproteobacteria bacterium]